MDETYEMAGQLAAGPPLAISMMKKSVYQGMSMDIRTHLEQTSSHMAVLFATEDHQEALNADRKSTRLNPVTNAHLVCRLLLEKKKHTKKKTQNNKNDK